ncbi:MAG: hypothetical protein EOO07_33080, partial [Chitinophagaceae bacterium]
MQNEVEDKDAAKDSRLEERILSASREAELAFNKQVWPLFERLTSLAAQVEVKMKDAENSVKILEAKNFKLAAMGIGLVTAIFTVLGLSTFFQVKQNFESVFRSEINRWIAGSSDDRTLSVLGEIKDKAFMDSKLIELYRTRVGALDRDGRVNLTESEREWLLKIIEDKASEIYLFEDALKILVAQYGEKSFSGFGEEISSKFIKIVKSEGYLSEKRFLIFELMKGERAIVN